MACKVNRSCSVSYDFEGQMSPTQYFRIEFLPHRKQKIWLILYAERTAVYSENRVKRIHTQSLWEKNRVFLLLK
jgi:hypothetical protein